MLLNKISQNKYPLDTEQIDGIAKSVHDVVMVQLSKFECFKDLLFAYVSEKQEYFTQRYSFDKILPAVTMTDNGKEYFGYFIVDGFSGDNKNLATTQSYNDETIPDKARVLFPAKTNNYYVIRLHTPISLLFSYLDYYYKDYTKSRLQVIFSSMLRDLKLLNELRNFVSRKLFSHMRGAISHEVTHVLFKNQSISAGPRGDKYRKLYEESLSFMSDKNIKYEDKLLKGVFYHTVKNEVESFASQVCSDISDMYKTHPEEFKRLTFEEALRFSTTWHNIKPFYTVDVGDATTFDGKLLSRKQKDAKHKILNKAYNHWKSLDDK